VAEPPTGHIRHAPRPWSRTADEQYPGRFRSDHGSPGSLREQRNYDRRDTAFPPAESARRGAFEGEIRSFRLQLAAEGKLPKTIRMYTEAVRWFAARSPSPRDRPHRLGAGLRAGCPALDGLAAEPLQQLMPATSTRPGSSSLPAGCAEDRSSACHRTWRTLTSAARRADLGGWAPPAGRWAAVAQEGRLPAPGLARG
jgi:hypothetical protein